MILDICTIVYNGTTKKVTPVRELLPDAFGPAKSAAVIAPVMFSGGDK